MERDKGLSGSNECVTSFEAKVRRRREQQQQRRIQIQVLMAEAAESRRSRRRERKGDDWVSGHCCAATPLSKDDRPLWGVSERLHCVNTLQFHLALGR